VRAARAFAVLLVVLGALLLVAPQAAESRYVGYRHYGTATYPRGQWVTVGTVNAGGCCRPTSFHVQVPVEWHGKKPGFIRVQMLRMPQRDGTGDLNVAVGTLRRWHITHTHTVKGWSGRMHMRVFVQGSGTWTAPYTVVKAVKH